MHGMFRPNDLNAQALGRKTAWGQSRTQRQPAASQNRRVALSPTDTLIDIKIVCRLRPIPVGCPVRLAICASQSPSI